ncbi:MAG: DNA recombination protein RmuC, partial [Lachnospiraceae bacterium]|nr:DNA recombination protein RmuC [Lachnospiraceae bacterium]
QLNIYVIVVLVILVLLLIGIVALVIIVISNNSKKRDESRYLATMIKDLEKNVIKDSNDGFVKILNQNQINSTNLTKGMQESLDKINNTNEKKLNEIRVANEEKLNVIEKNINEKLDKSLNERLDNSFKTIAAELQNLQKTNGELLSMSGTITDLQKSLSSVKERGVFGEKQLESIIESIMTSNMYERQFRLKKTVEDKIDVAIKIPNKDDDGFVYLPIDAKFPNDRYLDVVRASQERNEDALNVAIKALKDAIIIQARSISEKYIDPPITTEFAIMFLPTEGLYAEVLRINGRAEECQNKYKILLAGPTTITALINSFSIGFKFLQVNKNSKEIAKILQAIKVQYARFGDEIDKTKKSIEKAAESTDQLARRNQMITSKLKSFDGIGVEESDNILGIED